MSSLASYITAFFQSLTAIAVSIFLSVLAIFSSVLAIFHSILVLALGQDVVILFTNVLRLGQSLAWLVVDLSQSIVGFITANFVVSVLLGGGYYLYASRQKRKRTAVGKCKERLF